MQGPVFELEEANAVMTNMNVRLEKHGKEEVLACDLSLEYEMANTGLAMFSPALRSAFYQRSQGPQGELPGTDDADYMPSLRFPALSSHNWEAGELTGAELRFHYGATEKGHVVFEGAKIGKYRFNCKEGGTVLLQFKGQVLPTDVQMGKLSKILADKSCIISITPPKAEPSGE